MQANFKKNLIANYASQIYMSLAGIIILPLYLKYMGAEAYGLVGFFTLLQSLFNLFDLGLSPSISRETARMRAGALSERMYRELLRALQLVFCIIMMIGAGIVFLSAPYLAHSWLKVQTLSTQEVQTALELMAVSVALRWMCSLYRATIMGSEQFVWLCFYTWIFTTLRYLGVLFVLIYVSNSPFAFFLYQIIIAFFELGLLAIKSIKHFPRLGPDQTLSWAPTALLAALKRIMPFALSVSITTTIWIVITQIDKLILSRLLSLTEYGFFTLGVLAASGVMLFSWPFSMVLVPRLTKLKAEGLEDQFLNLYRQSTQLMASISIPASLVLALFPEQILWLWTNNLQVAQTTAPILRLYALGNVAFVFTTFPYYLQYAFGNLKLHVIGNSCFAAALVPAIIWATMNFGMIGAAWVWLLANSLFFIFWTAFVHHLLMKNLHLRWLCVDIIPIFLISLGVLWILKYSLNAEVNDKLMLFLQIAFISTMGVACNLAFIRYNSYFSSIKIKRLKL